MQQQDVLAGQAVYSKSVLAIYDLWVLGFSNRFLWRCPTARIGQLYARHLSANHLDVGVGTGYYLKKYPPAQSKNRRLALLDLNANSLASAAAAVQPVAAETYRANVLQPLQLGCRGFDSVSINYLLHCLPGPLAEKGVVFRHLKSLMNPGAVIFGSTILGDSVSKNAPARRLMALYNRKGIFSNQQDDFAALQTLLEAEFEQVELRLVGCVALFTARNPNGAVE